VSDVDVGEIHVRPHYFPGSWPAPEDLTKTLLASAGYHARAALVDYTRTDERLVDAAFHCGTAVEHLTKAFLASVHPVLLTEKGDFDSLLVLTGHARHAKKGRGTDIRTVGLEESCRRVEQLLPTFKREPGQSLVANVRNAAAHLSVTSRDDIRHAVRFMVELATPLITALETSPEVFWGELSELAAKLRDENAVEIDRIVASKLESARQLLARRTENLDDGTRAAVLGAIAGRPHWTQDYERTHPCPVCGQPALLICQFWEDGDDERTDPASGSPMPHVYAITDGFSCSACDLALDDAAETRALGMPEEIDLGYLPLDEYGLPVTPEPGRH
jgi:hypothetical protein